MSEQTQTKKVTGMEWFGFWIFWAVFIVCDTWIYLEGHTSLLHSHKTEHEKRIQEAKVQALELAGKGEAE
jgi:hypothetical protein